MSRERASALALVALALLASVVYVVSLPRLELSATNLATSYWRRYITESYRPEPIGPAEVGERPPERFIEGVPWISYRKAYCATTCLQMVAYKYGVKEPVEFFNFITGFTYGAYLGRVGGALFFIPGSDPLAGLARASKYLGLKYRLLVTEDEGLFLEAVRYLISKDLPVILPVDASRLYGVGGFSPHFVLAVGYSSDEIHIYEPVAEEGVRHGERGIPVRAAALAKAVAGMVRGMGYPVSWSYALICYAPDGGPGRDYREALEDCASLQAGVRFGGAVFSIYTGAYAFEALAKLIEEGGASPEVVSVGLSMAAVSRRDDAKFLKSKFPGDPSVLKAADMLEGAASIYEGAVEALKMGYAAEVRSAVAEKLREAAGYEREAGRLMALSAGRRG